MSFDLIILKLKYETDYILQWFLCSIYSGGFEKRIDYYETII